MADDDIVEYTNDSLYTNPDGSYWGADKLPSGQDVYNNQQSGKPTAIGTPGGSGGYSSGSPLVFSNDIWNANVGRNSTISGGSRTVGGGSFGGGYASKGGSTQSSGATLEGYAPFTAMPAPAYKSTYVAPDERKISALTAKGGGNALRATVGQLVNRTIAASSALPLAIRRQQMRQLSEEIASTYAKSMPNIRRAASSEWQALYGKPMSEDISGENQRNYSTWLASYNAALQEWKTRADAYSRYGGEEVASSRLGSSGGMMRV